MTPDPHCPSERRHGTTNAYLTDRCRCPNATADHSRTKKLSRLRALRNGPDTVHGAGTARRLRALLAAGWPKADMAGRLGVSTVRVDGLLRSVSVRRYTAVRVAALYADLADRPGPSRITEGKARALGYVPPAGWDDDTIDDPQAMPWAELDDKGQVRHSVDGHIVRRCLRDACPGFAVGVRLHCSERCRQKTLRGPERLARRRESWRLSEARKRARGVAA